MVDYDFKTNLGEVVSAIKIKAHFGIDINAEVDAIRDSLDSFSRGSDKIVWTPDGLDIIIKLAEGTQIKEVPVDFKGLFEPFYEYVLPTPVEFEDIIFYRVQVQRLLTPFSDERKTYYPNNNIKNHASHKAIDKQFLWELMKTNN